MKYFPFFFDMNGRRTLIVGGGEVAARKSELLIQAGAQPFVVAPTIIPKLTEAVHAAGGSTCQRQYVATDMKDCSIVISATDDEALNQQVFSDARAQRIPVNVVDNPALCDFIFPAIIDRSPLTVAVSSSGASPVLARRIRARIEEMLPANIGRLAIFCRRFRDTVKVALPATRRRLFWEKFLDGTAAEAILTGNETDGEKQLQKELEHFSRRHVSKGTVYLIGAGPGDPDLLTFRAHRLLQQADVVIYDRLVSPAILDLARRDAKKIFVGKQRNYCTSTQEEINTLLNHYAQHGQCVARLKGGDPFIFGRGGEELLALHAAGIEVEVVAGITAASGCAAAAGIPLTHRQCAHGVRFATAYQRGMDDSAHWQRLAEDKNCTLVFYMSGTNLASIAKKLIHSGRSPNTPVAVICAGSTPAQRIITGKLDNINQRTHALLTSPTLIIIGDVVALHQASENNSHLPSSFAYRNNHAIFKTFANG